jgi:hypothetical protein
MTKGNLFVVGFARKAFKLQCGKEVHEIVYIAKSIVINAKSVVPQNGDSGAPVWMIRDGVKYLHSFYKSDLVLSKNQTFHVLTPAHFALKQVQLILEVRDSEYEFVDNEIDKSKKPFDEPSCSLS